MASQESRCQGYSRDREEEGSFPNLEGGSPAAVSDSTSDGHSFNTEVCRLSTAPPPAVAEPARSQCSVALRCRKHQQHSRPGAMLVVNPALSRSY